MSFAPKYITIDERMKHGLCAPLHLGERPQRGLWYHTIPGTDITETVYDPRRWEKIGDVISQLRPKRVPTGDYFKPGDPLPRPTERMKCGDLRDFDVGADPRNWKFVGPNGAYASEAGSMLFEWIGPRLKTGTPISMYVPIERLHEMRGAKGLGQDYEESRSVLIYAGAALVAVGGAWWLLRRRRR